MMEVSVRFVCESRMNSNGKLEQLTGLKPAVCFRGQKNALAVINDDLWIRTIELDIRDHDKASFVMHHGEPYAPKPFADRLLNSAKSASKPVTRRAKHLLVVLDKADEAALPPEILEKEPVEQVRVYGADNLPKERIKAAQRPGPVKDVTKEYEGQLFVAPGATATGEDLVVESAESSRPPGLRQKTAKKVANGKAAPVTRLDVKKAHEAARRAVAKPEKKTSGKPAAERGTLIKRLAAELKIDAFELRVLIRSTGMRAPYEDEAKVRAAIKQGLKNQKKVVKK